MTIKRTQINPGACRRVVVGRQPPPVGGVRAGHDIHLPPQARGQVDVDDPQRARHAVPAGVQELATQRAELRCPHGIEEDGRREGAGGGGRAGLVSLLSYPTHTHLLLYYRLPHRHRNGTDGMETTMRRRRYGDRRIRPARVSSLVGDRRFRREGMGYQLATTLPACPVARLYLIHYSYIHFFSRFHPPTILNQPRRRAFPLHSFATEQKAELAEGASSAHEEGRSPLSR